MRRITVIFVAIILLIGFLILREFNLPEDTIPDITPTLAEPTTTPFRKVSLNNHTFAYAIQLVSNTAGVSLIENVNQEESSTLARAHNCASYVNGGFYDTKNTPLGQFVVDGKEKYAVHTSSTLNGFFGIDKLSHGYILDKPPIVEKVVFGLQAGPLLFLGGERLKISVSADELARRIVAFLTTDNKLYVAVLFDEESVFLGPTLTELPVALEQLAVREGLTISRAINLDGGTASVFKSSTVFLREFKTVGSILCV